SYRSHLPEVLKALVRLIALVIVSPVLLTFWLRSLVLGQDRALVGSSQLLSLIPGLPGQYLRRAFYSRVLAYCHHFVTIACGVLFSNAGARIEENVYIGPRCHIGFVHIGRESLLGAGVHVTSGPQTHGFGDLGKPLREQPGVVVKVHVGAGAWFGSAAVVMA